MAIQQKLDTVAQQQRDAMEALLKKAKEPEAVSEEEEKKEDAHDPSH